MKQKKKLKICWGASLFTKKKFSWSFLFLQVHKNLTGVFVIKEKDLFRIDFPWLYMFLVSRVSFFCVIQLVLFLLFLRFNIFPFIWPITFHHHFISFKNGCATTLKSNYEICVGGRCSHTTYVGKNGCCHCCYGYLRDKYDGIM